MTGKGSKDAVMGVSIQDEQASGDWDCTFGLQADTEMHAGVFIYTKPVN